MNNKELKETAKAIVTKGLLAMDESVDTCNKRFAQLGIPQTVEYRHIFREWILTTPSLGNCISGAILFDETIRHIMKDGTPFAQALATKGIIPGIKVDMGAKDMALHPYEKITEGLDGLRERIEEYRTLGARFAKWRAVITIGDDIPTKACIDANAHALARYAAICQDAGVVPIVEPEVLMDGTHTIERCKEVTREVLHTVFDQLNIQGILLEGMILKPSMILPALNCPKQASLEVIADNTITCFKQNVPATVGGIAFLSGGQPAELASARLNAMHVQYQSLPWELTFSFSRAIEQPALEIWKGKEENIPKAQAALYHRAKCNLAARKGEYTIEME
jgi:fructose-bisphosphate aldolase class I